LSSWQLPSVIRHQLQGSSLGVVLKDLDLQQQFKLDQSAARRVHEQLEADTRLLSSVRVMDYSMLLGVHQPLSDSSSNVGSKTAGPSQQHNFAEHSNEAGKPGGCHGTNIIVGCKAVCVIRGQICMPEPMLGPCKLEAVMSACIIITMHRHSIDAGGVEAARAPSGILLCRNQP
jgi:hypothetical protein